MEAFAQLKQKAQELRDKKVKQAKDEYKATLKRIVELEQDLLGKLPSDHRSLAECIESVMPFDTTFTTVDIMAGLQAIDETRDWRQRSIDSYLTQVRKKGTVKRIKRSRGTGNPAVYARIGVEVEVGPFEGMTLVECVAALLADGPMTQTELAIELMNRGYETAMNMKSLRNAIGTEMRNSNRFERGNNEKWAISVA